MRPTMLHRILALCVLLLCAASCACRAADDIQAVSAVWTDFSAALRAGEYARAHAMFTAQSQAAMDLSRFTAEYNPLSLTREMVTAKPESLTVVIDGEWAQLRYGGVFAGTGERFALSASLTRNEGIWALVADRNERPERIEAAARSLLLLYASVRGQADARERWRQALDNISSTLPVGTYYRFSNDSGVIAALSNTPRLRSFHLDAYDRVLPGGKPTPQPLPQALPQTAQPPAPAPMPEPNALWEPAEPPPLPGAGPEPPEMPEPPEPAGGVPTVSLPDFIG